MHGMEEKKENHLEHGVFYKSDKKGMTFSHPFFYYLNINFNKKLIEKCTKTQFELLKKSIKVLKPGKEMVYSTCSILNCENEELDFWFKTAQEEYVYKMDRKKSYENSSQNNDAN